jgi:16S rRNA (cytosine1402-N4)-methyltransferase
VLFDLGLSSDEIADSTKGLSFQLDGPLDMRLGPRANEDGLTAGAIINHWSMRELAQMMEVFGEERYAQRIAEAVVKARKIEPITSTFELVRVVRAALPIGYEKGRIHPATRTFQALRMAVNDEVPALKQAIVGAHDVLKPGGRLVIITFHSIEDRLVKRAFQQPGWQTLSKKPLLPSSEERQRNPRARSAKLRAARTIKE